MATKTKMSRWRGAIRPTLSASCLRWSTSRSSGSTSKIAIPLSMAAFSPMWSAAGSGSRPARPRRLEISEPEADSHPQPSRWCLGNRAMKAKLIYPSHVQVQARRTRADGRVSGGAGQQNQRRHRGCASTTERRFSNTIKNLPTCERRSISWSPTSLFSSASCAMRSSRWRIARAWLDGFAQRRGARTGTACQV